MGVCIFAFICEINAFRVDGTGLAEFLSGFEEIEGKMTRRARAKISRAMRNPAITYSRDFVVDTSSTVYPLLELKIREGKSDPFSDKEQSRHNNPEQRNPFRQGSVGCFLCYW
jgi:hypothetical protein